MSEENDLTREVPDVPRTFLSRAYLLQLEPGLYGLFRDVLQEDPESGRREKVGKPLGPIRLLRKKERPDETTVIRTVHPSTGEDLDLVEVT